MEPATLLNPAANEGGVAVAHGAVSSKIAAHENCMAVKVVL